MSILIRGMEMPRVCAECFMDPPCCKALSDDTNIWKERHPDCPLIELPFAEELAEKLYKQIEKAVIEGSET